MNLEIKYDLKLIKGERRATTTWQFPDAKISNKKERKRIYSFDWPSLKHNNI